MAVALEHDPDLRRYPLFRFNRFIDYLSRGIWPFLIHLILVLPIIPLVVVAMMVAVMFGVAMNPRNNPGIIFVLIGGVIAMEVLYLLLISLISIPMMFHAKFTGRFDLKGAFRFTWDFWKKVGFLALGTGIAYLIVSNLLSILGLLCCYVGAFVTVSLSELAGQHLMVQLYVIYLDRGGAPLDEYVPPPRDDDEYDDEYDEEDDYERDEYDRDDDDRHDRDRLR